MIESVLKQLAPKGYLRAAINLSNFLLVTGKESNGDPQGVSPDMARALAKELNVDIKLITFNRPGELADAISQDAWDIGNIANEPARAKSITFSLPYTTIESTFLIRNGLNIKTLKDVDKKGIKNSRSQSKIIRISLLTPKLGEGLENINELKKSELAWTTDFKTIKNNDDFEVIYENDVLNPWNLILKK